MRNSAVCGTKNYNKRISHVIYGYRPQILTVSITNKPINSFIAPPNIFKFYLAVRWLEVFPREQLLIVNGDQLIEDPLSQIRRIEDFLGECFG